MIGRNFIRFRSVLTSQGPFGVLRRAGAVLLRKIGLGPPGASLRFLIDLPGPVQAIDSVDWPPERMRLAWVVPDFGKGSGGHATIFRISAELQKLGFINEFWLMPDSRMSSADFARQAIQEWFTPQDCEVRKLEHGKFDEVSADACIATEFRTAYVARALPKVARRFYFVQDFEPWFFPCGADFWVAVATYRMGLTPITAGRWLAGEVARQAGLGSVRHFELAYDARHYFRQSGRAREELSVAFYLRETTPRRCAELGLLALELAAKRLPRLVVHLYGQPKTWMRLGFAYRHHGVLMPPELAELYRSCRVGLVLSATNHSLVPSEMLACGLPVVELDTPSTRSDYTPGALRLVPPDPSLVADAVVELLTDRSLWERQSEMGLRHVEGLDWERSAGQVAAGLCEISASQER